MGHVLAGATVEVVVGTVVGWFGAVVVVAMVVGVVIAGLAIEVRVEVVIRALAVVVVGNGVGVLLGDDGVVVVAAVEAVAAWVVAAC